MALILFILLLSAYDSGCTGGHGITVKIDGVAHTFSWR